MIPPELQVIYEDKYLLVVNKTPGIISEHEHHLKYTMQSLALEHVRQQTAYPKKCFIGLPHRLDRPVTGVLIMAKKRSGLHNLVEQFAGRTTRKTYLAVSSNRPEQEEGRLEHWLEKNRTIRKAILHSEEKKDTVKAVLNYKVISTQEGLTLFHIELITGKYHQIRAQLASINCPILGDVLYGGEALLENTISLHARMLDVKHPFTEKPMTFTAPVPAFEPWPAFQSVID